MEWSSCAPAWAAGWSAIAFQMCPFKTNATLPHTSLKWFCWLWWNYSRFHTFLTESINWPVCVAFPLFGNYFKCTQIRWISTGRNICSVVLINRRILWCSFRAARGSYSEFGSPNLGVPILLEVLSLTGSRQHRAGQIAGLPQQPLALTKGRSQFKVAVVTVCKALPGIHFSYQETVCHSMAATSRKSFILLLDWSVSEVFPADNRGQWSAVYTK